jgi:hypothetical protein
LRPSRNGSDDVKIAQQLFPGTHTFRVFLFDLASGAQEQFGIVDDALPYEGLATPGGIEHADFLGRELMVGNLLSNPFTVVWFGARHRYQVLHGRMRSDFPKAHVLLHRLRQLVHQRQPARYPRHAPIETPGEIVQAQTKAAMQFGKQPSLFEGGFSFRGAQGPIQYQRLGFVHIPNRGAHRIVPETLKRPDSLVSVNDQEPVRFRRQADDDNGDLLPPFGEGRQQAAFTVRSPYPKTFMA